MLQLSIQISKKGGGELTIIAQTPHGLFWTRSLPREPDVVQDRAQTRNGWRAWVDEVRLIKGKINMCELAYHHHHHQVTERCNIDVNVMLASAPASQKNNSYEPSQSTASLSIV